MTKRLLALLLAVMTVVMVALPGVTYVSAEDYPNTHVNTGDQRHDIVQIALTQLGYTESTTDKSGSNGYTKYGDFYGYPYADWCGCFINWCARKAEIPTSVLPRTGLTKPNNWGLTAFRSSDRIPQPGDIFFKCWTNGNYAGHVGIVYQVDVDRNICYTIEGNTGSRPGDGCAYIVKIVERTLSQHAYGSPNYSGSSNSGHSHSYSDHFEDAHPHKIYKQCDTCGYTTYTGEKKTLDSCTECIQANCSHSYGSWETSGDNQHKRVCTKCQKAETGNHDWDDVKTVKEANCKESGSKLQKCSVCAAERTKTIDKTSDHTYGDWEYVNDQLHKRACSFCGYAETKEHTLGEEPVWATDDSQHWHECSVCQEKIGAADHAFGEDCVSPCDTCGFVRADGHIYPENLSYNETEHWFSCENCDERGNVEAHVYSAECDEDCDICGYVRQVKHSFSTSATNSNVPLNSAHSGHSGGSTGSAPMTDMSADATGHWYECSVCGKREGVAAHTPGPEATEEAAQVCTLCNYEIAPKLDHVHKYEPFQSNTLTHWGKCACGYELAPESHVWDMATGSCATCGVKSIVETDNTNWDIIWVAAGGVLVLAVILSASLMAAGRRKRKQLEADPYWA